MRSTSRSSRAEIVMDCIAIAAIAILVLFTLVFIAGSPALPFGGSGAHGCAPHCTNG